MEHVFTGNNSIPYELVGKPFFGSLKNAYVALKDINVTLYKYEDFLRFIEKCYPNEAEDIELVRFYEFTWTFNSKYGDNFHFSLAIIYTKPCAKTRDSLFFDRNKITSYTGWYPYIVGSRANVTKTIHKSFVETNNIDIKRLEVPRLGKPLSLHDISSHEGANAILLKCERGSILFDTGFGVNLPPDSNLKAVCISHFHADHVAGIMSILNTIDVPFIMSETTLEYILISDYLSNQEKIRLTQNTTVLEKLMYGKIFRDFLDFFPIFHCPGSSGFVYKGYRGISVYYFGDICLKNGFFDFQNQINNLLQKDDNTRKYIIMDAALIGKSAFTIDPEDIPEVVINDIVDLVKKKNVAFISTSIETLIYLYILTFIRTNRLSDSSRKIIVNKTLYDTMKTLWGSVILKDRFAISDPFIKNVLGENRHNFIESQRLYPLSAIQTISKEEAIFSFLSIEDLANPEIIERLKVSNIILVGAWTVKASIPEAVSALKPRSVLRISSPDWSFHSTEQSIIEATTLWETYGAKTILFHNYSKVLRKFCKATDNHTDYIKEIVELD